MNGPRAQPALDVHIPEHATQSWQWHGGDGGLRHGPIQGVRGQDG